MSKYYTCEGKGGLYVLLGSAIGAGTSRGQHIEIYQDFKSGQLYFRTTGDFDRRMVMLSHEEALEEINK